MQTEQIFYATLIDETFYKFCLFPFLFNFMTVLFFNVQIINPGVLHRRLRLSVTSCQDVNTIAQIDVVFLRKTVF